MGADAEFSPLILKKKRCSCLYIRVCVLDTSVNTLSCLSLPEEEIETMMGIKGCANSAKRLSHRTFDSLDLGWLTPWSIEKKKKSGI